MKQSSFLKGTIILTIATAISKILGFIYIIPFTALVGTSGYILFEYAYKPYVIILSIATMGIPLAVSKFVSKYNELGNIQAGKKLFKSGIIFMSITAILTFLLLYFSSPWIASILIDESSTTGNAIEDVIFVIKMVSFALLIVPPMAFIRGYFQGHHYMTPTAVSQVIEQLVRIILILVGSYVVIKILDKSTSLAVGIATFAACIGAIAGFITLFFYKNKIKKDETVDTSKNVDLPLSSMYKELISYAIPIVIVGLAIPFYQTLDTFMINRSFMSIGYTQGEAETVNSVIALVQKIILIPVSLATAFGLTLIPVITQSFTAKNIPQLHHQIKKTLDVIFFLTLPAVAGLVVLGYPSFVTLFGTSQGELGSFLMVVHAPTAILFALFIVTSSMLQGINQQNWAVYSLFIGFLAKVILNYPFIVMFEEIGVILTTNIGFFISLSINFWILKKQINYPLNQILTSFFTSLRLVVIMSIFVLIVDFLLKNYVLLNFSSFQEAGIRLIIGGIVGACIYFLLSIKTKIIFDVLGNRIKFLNRFNK